MKKYTVIALSFSLFSAACSKNESNLENSNTLFQKAERMYALIGLNTCPAEDKRAANRLESRLDSCSLTSKKVGSDSRDIQLSKEGYVACVDDSFNDLNSLKSVECKKTYLKYYLDVTRDILGHRAEKIAGNIATNSINEVDLREFFTLLNLWVSRMESILLKGRDIENIAEFVRKKFKVPVTELIPQEVEGVLREFWKQVLVFTRSNPEFLKQEKSFSHSLNVASEIIKIVDSANIDDRVFFPVMAKILSPIQERVNLIATVYDFKCEVGDCRSRSQQIDDFATTVEVLSVLDKPDRLKVVKDFAKLQAKVEAIQDPVVRDFDKNILSEVPILQERQSRLIPQIQVVTKSGGKQSSLRHFSEVPQDLLPSSVREYVGFSSFFSELFYNYKFTGLFKKKKMADLDFGLTPENIAEIKHLTAQQIATLQTSAQRYEGELPRVAEELVRDREVRSQKLKVIAELNKEGELLDYLTSDLRGAQTLLRDQGERFSKYSNEADRLLNSERWKTVGGQALATQLDQYLSITASDAKFNPTELIHSQSPIQQISIDGKGLDVIHAEQGDRISIQALGKVVSHLCTSKIRI